MSNNMEFSSIDDLNKFEGVFHHEYGGLVSNKGWLTTPTTPPGMFRIKPEDYKKFGVIIKGDEISINDNLHYVDENNVFGYIEDYVDTNVYNEFLIPN